MKKIISLVLVIFVIIFNINVNAVSVKEAIIESKDEVIVNEEFDLKVKINFSDFNKEDKNGLGIALVYYELLFDDNVFNIINIEDNYLNSKVYKDKDNKYYVISSLSKNNENKCNDKILYCSDYEVILKLYAKRKDDNNEIKIGDVIIGLLPMINSKKEITEEDVTLINVSGKSNKVLKIKENDVQLGDINDIVILKDKIEITKQMVLESKDNSYSLDEKDNYIEKLEISEYDFNFKKYTNDYILKIKEDVMKLDFKIELSNKDASYEIIGNNNLMDNSEIKIEVKAKNNEINTYKIKIIKEKEDIKEIEEKKNFFNIDFDNIDYKLIGIIVGSILGLILIIKLIMLLHDRKLEKKIKKL